MPQKKVVKSRTVTADGQVIAKASSVLIMSSDSAVDSVVYQQVVDVNVAAHHVQSYTRSHVTSVQ